MIKDQLVTRPTVRRCSLSVLLRQVSHVVTCQSLAETRQRQGWVVTELPRHCRDGFVYVCVKGCLVVWDMLFKRLLPQILCYVLWILFYSLVHLVKNEN